MNISSGGWVLGSLTELNSISIFRRKFALGLCCFFFLLFLDSGAPIMNSLMMNPGTNNHTQKGAKKIRPEKLNT